MKSFKKIINLNIKLLLTALIATTFTAMPAKAELNMEPVIPKSVSEQEYNFPEYTIKGRKPDKVYYIAEMPMGDKLINNPKEAEGWPYFLNIEYHIYLDDNGRIYLLHHEFHFSEKRFFQKGDVKLLAPPFFGKKVPKGYKLVIEGPYNALNLYINDNGDEKFNRILTDETNKEGKLGADGIFEIERKLFL